MGDEDDEDKGPPCEGCGKHEAHHRTVDDVALCTLCWDSHIEDSDDGQDLPDNVLSFAPRSTGACRVLPPVQEVT